jgi:molecular chaperone HscB
MNYFELFDLPISLSIDKADLRRRYYARSRAVHPDLQVEQEEQAAAITNEAYRVLSDDDARLRHLLSLHHVHTMENEQLPPDFLMEMMEINEAIMEIETDADAQPVLGQVAEYEATMAESIADLHTTWPTLPDQITNALERLKMFAIKRRYILRIRENLSKFAPLTDEG